MSKSIPYTLVSEWIYENMEKRNRYFCENDYIRAQSEIFKMIDTIINNILDDAEEAKKIDDSLKQLYEDGIISELIQTHGNYYETNEELIEAIKENKRKIRELEKKKQEKQKKEKPKKKTNVRKKQLHLSDH